MSRGPFITVLVPQDAPTLGPEVERPVTISFGGGTAIVAMYANGRKVFALSIISLWPKLGLEELEINQLRQVDEPEVDYYRRLSPRASFVHDRDTWTVELNWTEATLVRNQAYEGTVSLWPDGGGGVHVIPYPGLPPAALEQIERFVMYVARGGLESDEWCFDDDVDEVAAHREQKVWRRLHKERRRVPTRSHQPT